MKKFNEWLLETHNPYLTEDRWGIDNHPIYLPTHEEEEDKKLFVQNVLNIIRKKIPTVKDQEILINLERDIRKIEGKMSTYSYKYVVGEVIETIQGHRNFHLTDKLNPRGGFGWAAQVHSSQMTQEFLKIPKNYEVYEKFGLPFDDILQSLGYPKFKMVN